MQRWAAARIAANGRTDPDFRRERTEGDVVMALSNSHNVPRALRRYAFCWNGSIVTRQRTTTPGELSLKLLGDTEVLVDGQPLRVDTRKAIALLAYLAVTQTSASRDQLSGLLWSEAHPERARGALRRTLSVLRQALDARWIEVEGDRIRLAVDESVGVDVNEAAELMASTETHGHSERTTCPACRKPLEAAAGLYQGDFMAGFTLRDGLEFEEWLLRESDTLRHRQGRTLERLADCLAGSGEYQRAVEVSKERLILSPLDEDAHRQVMRMNVWAGDRASALRQYRECVRILDEELGVPPLPETSTLEERILCDDIPPPPVAPVSEIELAASAEPSDGRWPLVGRGSELTLLERTIVQRGGRSAVVTGAPGVGKTRLADEIAERVATQGRRVVRARAYSGEESLGFLLIGEALRTAVETWDVPPSIDPRVALEASRLLPALRPADAEAPIDSPLDPGGSGRFTEAVCTALAELIGEDGLLILDDLQWADSASLGLLGYLLRRRDRFGVSSILIWRTFPSSPGHPLQSIVDELAPNGGVTEVRLAPLDDDEVKELATRVVPGIDDAAAGVVIGASDGIPLVTLQYLSLVDPDTGRLDQSAGLADVAETRLRGISALARQILSAAAVIGRSFEVGEVHVVSGRSDDELALGLEELVGAGLLLHTDSERLDFSHDLIRQHVRLEVSALRARVLNSRLADHLLTRHRRHLGHAAGRLAAHLEEAGRLDESGEMRALAGDHARSVFAHHEALRHYEAALALGHPDPSRMHRSIGDLHTLSGDYTRALEAYRTAASRAEGAELAVVEHRLAEIHGRLGRWEIAEEHFVAAEHSSDPPDRVELYTDWARVAHRQNDVERARELVERALVAADAAGKAAPASTLIMRGVFSLDPDDARRHVLRGLDLARQNAEPGAEAAGLTALARIAQREGRSSEAIERVLGALELVELLGDRHRQAALHDLLGDLLHLEGDKDGSRREVTRAVELFAEVGTGGLEPEIWKTAPW
ncbi:AAA family ATPase [soil metagenome]